MIQQESWAWLEQLKITQSQGGFWGLCRDFTLEEPGLDKRCKNNKEPGLTNQRLVRIIKRNPCRKARLLGIKRKTFLEQIIPPLGVKREASPSTKSRQKQEEFQPCACDLAVTPQEQDKK
jgi:hypothetical protein